MDDSNDLERLRSLDESFVAGALHREPSHHERVLEVERRQAQARARRYRAELDHGLEQARRSRRRRSRHAPESVSAAPSRRRKVVGVCIAVVVLLAAYLPTQLAHGGVRPVAVGLGPASPQAVSCSKSVYPAGAAYSFERCWNGLPIGWGRCATVTVSVDPSDAPRPWRPDTADALGQLADATGLRFRSVKGGAAQIKIGWASTIVSPGSSRADKAGVTRVQARSSAGGAVLVSAAIQVSSRLTGGIGPNGEVPVLLHELGHAVGLGHYLGPEVMNPVDQGYGTYQPGDLAGLARLYGPRGCT